MLKYVSKFVLDILPSVVATIIGAYIVNHYIVTRPADPPAAAAVATVDSKKSPAIAEANKPAKPVPTPELGAELASAPAADERPSVEKPSVEKTAEKPAENASVPAEAHRHKPALREKAVAKITPPVAATAATSAIEPEEHRDATDLARAAIERLRHSNEASGHPQETPRVNVVASQPVQPLPPAIMVATPSSAETIDVGSTASIDAKPPYAAARADDRRPRPPTPPADIPYASRPIDLRADSAEPLTASEYPRASGHTTVADDVLSAASSVFHAVLPR